MPAPDPGAASCFSVGSVAGTYDEIYLPRIFMRWAKLLLERAALRPGEAVLDIATGANGVEPRDGTEVPVRGPHPERLKRSPGTKAPLAWADGPGERGRVSGPREP